MFLKYSRCCNFESSARCPVRSIGRKRARRSNFICTFPELWRNLTGNETAEVQR